MRIGHMFRSINSVKQRLKVVKFQKMFFIFLLGAIQGIELSNHCSIEEAKNGILKNDSMISNDIFF